MPRTLAQNAEYIANTIKPAIKSAIEAQGVTVPSTDSFLDYADRIGEIEGGGSGYQLKDLPTGSISTVNDAAELPLNALKVSVEAQQDLHGYDHPWVGGAGINKFPYPQTQSFTQDGYDISVNGDGSYTVRGNGNGGVVYIIINLDATYQMPNGQDYTLALGNDAETSNSGLALYFNGTYIDQAIFSVLNRKTHYSGFSNITYNQIGFRLVEPIDITIKPYVYYGNPTDSVDFSPYSNICPIIGWDSATINDFVVNVWDEEWEVGGINDSTGEKTPATTQIRSVNLIPCIGGNAYKIYSATTNISIYIYYYDRLGEFIGRAGQSGAYDVRNQVLTTPGNCGYMMLKAGTLTTYNHDISINYPSSDTSYHAYQGNQYTLNFPQTIYGAEWDVVGGVLKQTDGYIASYNGESLPSTWISDRDEYASGTTPTIGAEVVYKLATPTTINLSPLSIRLLEGTNNLYADCGEVIEGEYFVDEGAHRYQLYDYIESDGTQVIDLGRQVSSGDTFDIHFGTTNTTAGWSVAWCAYDGSAITGMGFSGSLSNRQYFDNNVQKSTITTARNSIYSDTFTVSNAMSANICIFAANSSAESSSIYRLYSFAINGSYYLPTKRKSDGVFGLWDVANQTFLTDSAGGNAFVGGNPTGVEV